MSRKWLPTPVFLPGKSHRQRRLAGYSPYVIYFSGIELQELLAYFEINSLSIASFAIIFSHSDGGLFTLLNVSFVVQKLLILIRSHLFIFAFIFSILGGGS